MIRRPAERRAAQRRAAQGTGQRYGADDNFGATYYDARNEAIRRGDRTIGTEHLVLALLSDPASPAARALGCDLHSARRALDALDSQALAAIGVPPGITAGPVAVRAAGRLRLTPAAKAVVTGLRGAGQDREAGPRTVKDREAGPGIVKDREAGPRTVKDREAGPRTVKDREAGPGSVKDREAGAGIVLDALLGLRRPDPAAELLAALGVEADAVRERFAGAGP